MTAPTIAAIHDLHHAKTAVRVAHVVFGLDIGGMERTIVEIAKHSHLASIAPHVVSLTRQGALSHELDTIPCPVAMLDQAPGLRPSMVWKLRECFKTWNIDVVHTHNTKALVYGAPAARLARVKAVIHTRHGLGHGGNQREQSLVRIGCRLATSVACVSEDVMAQTIQWNVPARKVHCIQNGVDVERFKYRGPAPSGPIMFVGRLSPEKSVDTLLEALAVVVTRLTDARLEVIGGGKCLDALRRQAASLAIADRIHFVGPAHDISERLARASLLVLPSTTEGLPISLLEAMAVGLPVVATSVGGNVEAVRNNKTGLLVPPRNALALATAIVSILSQPDIARRMGLAGRERVESQFNVRNMVAQYGRLYRGNCKHAVSE